MVETLCRSLKPNVITAVHSLYVNFELLRLAEFSATKITQRSGALRISSTSISSMHFQIVQSQEKLPAELTLVRALTLVKLLRVFHDILLPQNCHATNFTMIFSDGETEAGIVEHGAVSSIVKWMIKAEVTATAVLKDTLKKVLKRWNEKG